VIAYIDSSVLLRIVLRQPNALREWRSIRKGISSALIEVECLRTLDRLRFLEGWVDEKIAVRREAVFRLIETMEIIEPTRAVLSRAAQPMPTALGTLDAIHLASALLWKEQGNSNLIMATHDAALATAASASGLRVLGV
jgi:predicted nucleic acid-binding protein